MPERYLLSLRRSPQELAVVAACLVGAVVIGWVAGRASTSVAVLLATVPLLLLFLQRFRTSLGVVLVVGATAAQLFQYPSPTSALVIGPLHIFLTDVVLLLAIAYWALGPRVARDGTSRPPIGLFLVLVVVLGVCATPGLLRGHEDFGVSLLGNVTRLVAYSLVGLAAFRYAAGDFEKGFRWAFAGGLFAAALLGLYYSATGHTATAANALSTGGTRVLPLTLAMYAAMATVFMLVMITLRPGRSWPWLEWLALGAGAIVQVLALGRATMAALMVLGALIVLGTRRTRRSVALVGALAIPLAVVGIVIAHPAPPPAFQTAQNRVFQTSLSDRDIDWRVLASDAVMEGYSDHRWTGLGFGRDISFVVDGNVINVRAGDPHNGFVYLLGGGGLLALLSFSLVILSAFGVGLRRLVRTVDRDRPVLLWATCSLVIYLANVATEPYLSQANNILILWIFVGLIMLTVPRETNRPLRVGARFRP
jgi:O-antigen ligase